MRKAILAVIVGLVLGVAAVAGPMDDPVVAPIKKFIDSFNKGDAAGAAATHAATPDVSIIDEVAPYFWQGPKAFQDWSAALGNDGTKKGITDQIVILGVPTRVETEGDRAYVVVPSMYTFKEKGVTMREEGQMTFALQKGAGGWLIHAWTWTGPKPKPV